MAVQSRYAEVGCLDLAVLGELDALGFQQPPLAGEFPAAPASAKAPERAVGRYDAVAWHPGGEGVCL